MDKFNQLIQHKFFENTLFFDKELDFLCEEDFVMYYLNSYLKSFDFRELKTNGMIEYSHNENNEFYYKATSTGIAFYKLLYLTQLYCERSESIVQALHLSSIKKEMLLNKIDGNTFKI